MTTGRRLLILWLLITALVSPLVNTVDAQEAEQLQITSSRYIVIDAATGNIFAQRDANDRVPIASLTKVFTAVQALSMASLDTPITTSDFDMRTPDGDYFGSNGTLMGFGAGETYTLEDMIYGMLLPSGNDAAIAIARNLGARPGDSDEEAVQHFMDLLNQRVADMGLTNTHFMNPHGWGVEDHYSSAADVASFYRYVTQFPRLMEIMGTREYTTSNGYVTVRNTNRSLTLYPSVESGKTGYDDDAGYCLVNFARRDEVEMIAVTLDGVAPGDWYDDNATLLDYGFEQQAALADSGQEFTGDRLAFTDPAAADIGRSAKPAGEFTSSSPSEDVAQAPPIEPTPPPDQHAGTVPEPTPPARIPEGSLMVALVAVAGVIGLRGVFSFRRAGLTIQSVRDMIRRPLSVDDREFADQLLPENDPSPNDLFG